MLEKIVSSLEVLNIEFQSTARRHNLYILNQLMMAVLIRFLMKST